MSYSANNFITEFKKLYCSSLNNIKYESWDLRYEPRCICLVGFVANRVHLIFKINVETLDLYGPRDLKPRGNLNNEHNGFDLFDKQGLIYNIHPIRKEKRIERLLAIKKKEMEIWKAKSLDYTILDKPIDKSSNSREF